MNESVENWPLPDPAAVAHSERLIDFIRARIQAGGGSIPFDQYMDHALYAPGLGYYAAGARKFGAAGDFITAPEASSLFSGCLARQCMEVLRELGSGEILELGAGSGVMAADVLAQLEALGSLPERYFILEVSPDLRERQRETIKNRLPKLIERVVWLDAPPTDLRGVLLANEVLDALPVSRFRVDESGVQELHVAWEADRFSSVWKTACEQLDAAVRHVIADLEQPLELPYESELCLRLPPFIETFSESLNAGVMLFVDYGYPRREYYLPERREGTLMCHYRHRAHGDPFVYPGLQDITAFVDFTAVAEAAMAADLELMGFTSQAQFLLAGGLNDMLPEFEPGDTLRSLRVSQEVQRLTLPGEMGDRFKVMGLSRGLENIVSGFGLRDLSSSL